MASNEPILHEDIAWYILLTGTRVLLHCTYTVDAIIITLHECKSSKVVGSVVVVDTKIARSQYL